MMSWALAVSMAVASAQAAPPPPVVTVAPPTQVDPARLALAQQLLEATHVETQYDNIFARLVPVMSVQLFNTLKNNVKVPEAVRQRLADPTKLGEAKRIFAEEAVKGFKAKYGDLKLATAREYAAAFTANELTQLLAYYRSPIGQKALEVLPSLQAKLMPIGMATGSKVGEEAVKRTFQRLDLSPPIPGA